MQGGSVVPLRGGHFLGGILGVKGPPYTFRVNPPSQSTRVRKRPTETNVNTKIQTRSAVTLLFPFSDTKQAKHLCSKTRQWTECWYST